jgi:glucokinase
VAGPEAAAGCSIGDAATSGAEALPVADPWLLADIGGTNVRFGLVGAPGREPPQHVVRLRCADHAGPAEAARVYLDGLAASLGAAYRAPRIGAFAVATAVGGDRVELTNSRWSFSRSQTRHDLGLDDLLVLNDFEALALSLPHLGADDLRAHGELPAAGHGTRAVIGPGTGLGVAGLLHIDGGWRAIAGEGGHATLAAADDFEAEVLGVVRREFEHVSAERLLSGIGLPLLHRAVATVQGQPAADLPTETIVARGVDGGDALCARTLDTFCAMLGSFAGSVALVLGARGGVYVGGGIVPRFADHFFASRFRDRFEAKGRFRPYLQAIPTALIVAPYATLAGAAAAIAQQLCPPCSSAPTT